MGGVGSGVAVGLEVREQRPQGGHLAADSTVGLVAVGEGVSPGGDVLGADGGELFPGCGLDVSVGQELAKIALIHPAGMGEGGSQHPRLDGLRHLLAEVGGQFASECRDRVRDDRHNFRPLPSFPIIDIHNAL